MIAELNQQKEMLDATLKEHLGVCTLGQTPGETLSTTVNTATSTITQATNNDANTDMTVAIPEYWGEMPSNDVISPGPSEPFTPNLENDGRNYFMYPDPIQMGTGEDALCKSSYEFDFLEGCGIDTNLEENDLQGAEDIHERFIDIQTILNLDQQANVSGHAGNIPQSVGGSDQAYITGMVPFIQANNMLVPVEPSVDNTGWLNLFASIPGMDNENVISDYQNEAEGNQWQSLPFADLSGVDGNRH